MQVIAFGVIIFLRSYKQYRDIGVTLHLILVAILGSFTVISAKAVSGMLALTIEGMAAMVVAIIVFININACFPLGITQLIYPIFYVMLAVMVVTTLLQVSYK